MFELASIIVFGIAAQWLAWRLKVPAILPLILIGLAVGPISTFFTADGSKFIQPVYNGSEGLFPGKLLFYFVSLAIGIILFEGGLTLKRKEIRGVGPVILKLISLGSAITFVGGAFAAHFIVQLSWSLSFLFSGLIIVTGPTVIAPILRNIPLKRDIATVLKWEGILIDPIGALVAVLVFNFISSGGGMENYSSHAFGEFSKILVIGVAVGFGMAYFLKFMLRQGQVPHYLLNVFTLALVVFAFAGSDLIVHESGLLTVVVMGMVLGNMDLPEMREILYFKESLSVILIAILFILLSANIDMSELEYLWNWRPLLLFLIVVFILRPVGVFASTYGSNLTKNDKAFISWVGPRGIVAAGIASLFGISLVNLGVTGAKYITPLVFMVVLGTVLLNATTARWLAKHLGVTKKTSDGILMIGASLPVRLIGKYLLDQGHHVALVDTNPNNIRQAKELQLEAYEANVYSDELVDNLDFLDMGYLMAMTGSTEVNKYSCESLGQSFGENGTFRLLSSNEMRLPPEQVPPVGMFSSYDDYINLSEVARDYPNIHEIIIEDASKIHEIMAEINKQKYVIPLFVKRKDDGLISIVPADHALINLNDGDELVYLGKEYHYDKSV
jgi:NhaP-type Na+/H+ or K+/H+ antiporter